MTLVGFRDVVIAGCKKLICEYGFRLRNGGESYVEIESNNVVISFAYDRVRAFEVNVGIGLKSMEESGGIPYNLGEVMRQFNVPRSEERSYLQSSSLERIADFVNEACEALIEHCKPILVGDQVAFESVRSKRAGESKRYTLEIGLDSIRKEADEAWRAKDYAKYRGLLTGFESVLTESEKKKLEFSIAKASLPQDNINKQLDGRRDRSSNDSSPAEPE